MGGRLISLIHQHRAESIVKRDWLAQNIDIGRRIYIRVGHHQHVAETASRGAFLLGWGIPCSETERA